MIHCVYKTDSEWARYLYLKGYRENINFWRKDKRRLHLTKGDYFYFKIRGTPYIIGRGQFSGMEIMPIKEAWDRFGDHNGAESYHAFAELCKKTLEMNESLINCIILNDIEWLKPRSYYEMNEDIFPKNIMEGKYFQGDEIEDLINLFQKSDCKQNENQTNDLYLSIDIEPKKYFEGARKISIHNEIERNLNLIDAIKGKREWNCDICNLNFEGKYGVSYIEAHHKVPLSNINKQVASSEEDIALLCPNCHCAVHKYMLTSDGDYDYIKNEICNRLKSTNILVL